jgi:hypothetical protein
VSGDARGAAPASAYGIDRKHRRVIFASSLGTVFEWFDFYLYGTLAVFFGALFFRQETKPQRSLRVGDLRRRPWSPLGAVVRPRRRPDRTQVRF